MAVVTVTVLVLIGLVIAAYFIGRFVQWTSDARSVMGSRLGRKS